MTEEKSISRRTVAKGIAWATPVIAMASVVPSAAASVPVGCIPVVTNAASGWVVDQAPFPGCNQNSHPDLLLQFDVIECDEPVTIEVQNVPGAAYWCALTDQTTTVKTVSKVLTQGITTYVPEPGSMDAGCYHPPHTDTAIDDGIHLNPCSSGPFMLWRYRVGNGPFTDWAVIEGITALLAEL